MCEMQDRAGQNDDRPVEMLQRRERGEVVCGWPYATSLRRRWVNEHDDVRLRLRRDRAGTISRGMRR
jgi:hypothetical protein